MRNRILGHLNKSHTLVLLQVCGAYFSALNYIDAQIHTNGHKVPV